MSPFETWEYLVKHGKDEDEALTAVQWLMKNIPWGRIDRRSEPVNA